MLHPRLPGIAKADLRIDVGVPGKQRALGDCMRLAGLTVVLWSLAAAAAPARAHPPTRYAYTLVDVGTFGGPQAGQGNSASLNESGAVVGTADTSVLDPFGVNESGAFNGDPFVQHAYSWQRGTLTDLGALGSQPANNSSYTNAINERGHAAGLSDNGSIDPLLGTAETDAVLWRNGTISDLGTLGGHESQAFALNDRDQVVGVAANAVPDAVSMLGWGAQARAFLWQKGQDARSGHARRPGQLRLVGERSGSGGGSVLHERSPESGHRPAADRCVPLGSRQMRDLGSLGGSVTGLRRHRRHERARGDRRPEQSGGRPDRPPLLLGRQGHDRPRHARRRQRECQCHQRAGSGRRHVRPRRWHPLRVPVDQRPTARPAARWAARPAASRATSMPAAKQSEARPPAARCLQQSSGRTALGSISTPSWPPRRCT